MSFEALAKKIADQRGAPLFGAPLLCFDPGRTTGWAYFHEAAFIEGGELHTDDLKASLPLVKGLLDKYVPTIIVVEDYRVYKWKTDQHAWSELFVSQLIGLIETLALMESIPVRKQSAQMAKSFANDRNLEKWGLWVEGARHERDAIRHGCYFIVEGANRWMKVKSKVVNPHRVG